MRALQHLAGAAGSASLALVRRAVKALRAGLEYRLTCALSPVPLVSGRRDGRFNSALRPVSVSIHAAAAILIIALLPLAAQAHPPGSPWAAWFMAQKIPDGTGVSCCQESDAHVLEEEDIRINGGEYEVHINGRWVVFPNTGEGHKGNRVLGPVGNPVGKPVAWYSSYGTPYCLAPGSGT